MNKEKWERGAGEAIGFTFAVTFLMLYLIVSMSLFNYVKATDTLNYAVQEITRGVVVCETRDEAYEKAQKFINNYFTDNPSMSKDRVKVYIDYANGSDKAWEKGNYIDVSLSAYIRNYTPLASGYKEVAQLAMIENSKQSDLGDYDEEEYDPDYWEDYDTDLTGSDYEVDEEEDPDLETDDASSTTGGENS